MPSGRPSFMPSTMRQPKCRLLATLGRWLKITRTSSSRVRSSDRRARASAVLLPAAPTGAGSEKQKYSVRLLAKPRSSTTSSRPPCPPAANAGRPATGGFRRPLASTTRKRPGRSVTRKRPSGRKATAHGFSSPCATGMARTGPAAGCAQTAGAAVCNSTDAINKIAETDHLTLGCGTYFSKSSDCGAPRPRSRAQPAARA
ncbi:MAG: hypothetical protein BWX79_02659 [Alphaproteobacteria bacterium ADurb.Bin100]|nr:MAG: hypothetical protein BWX79_02659 [Alphaproteobacteria bacterium ADurb.Bin100]